MIDPNEFEDEEKELLKRTDFGFIPHQIDPRWHPTYGTRLAGFPSSIYYAAVKEDSSGRLRTLEACYFPDPESFIEDDDHRQMAYYRRDRSPYWVMVTYKKQTGLWQTHKYRGEEAVRYSQGGDFKMAMWHATMGGPEPDEGIEANC